MIPAPERVTPAWLTEALRASGAAADGARVTDVAPAPVGGGKLARCLRLHLCWSPSGAGPETVIGKFAAADERTRRTGTDSDAYRRELLFYRRLAPAVPIRVPRCHLAEAAGTGEFVLLLGDAAPARPRYQVRGAAPDDVALALGDLARLQARFWGGAGLSGQQWLPVPGPAADRRRAAAYRVTADGFLARFGARLSPRARAVVTGFAARVRRWAAAHQPPYTLLHGDFRLDNLLFGDTPGTAPLTVVDWQTVAVGPGPSDAAYLVGGALPVGVRRDREEELLRHYRGTLAAAGVCWGEAKCRRAWRLGALAGLHMTVVGAMLVAADAASDDMFVSLAERHAAHVTDLEAFDVLDQER